MGAKTGAGGRGEASLLHAGPAGEPGRGDGWASAPCPSSPGASYCRSGPSPPVPGGVSALTSQGWPQALSPLGVSPMLTSRGPLQPPALCSQPDPGLPRAGLCGAGLQTDHISTHCLSPACQDPASGGAACPARNALQEACRVPPTHSAPRPLQLCVPEGRGGEGRVAYFTTNRQQLLLRRTGTRNRSSRDWRAFARGHLLLHSGHQHLWGEQATVSIGAVAGPTPIPGNGVGVMGEPGLDCGGWRALGVGGWGQAAFALPLAELLLQTWPPTQNQGESVSQLWPSWQLLYRAHLPPHSPRLASGRASHTGSLCPKCPSSLLWHLFFF